MKYVMDINGTQQYPVDSDFAKEMAIGNLGAHIGRSLARYLSDTVETIVTISWRQRIEVVNDEYECVEINVGVRSDEHNKT